MKDGFRYGIICIMKNFKMERFYSALAFMLFTKEAFVNIQKYVLYEINMLLVFSFCLL